MSVSNILVTIRGSKQYTAVDKYSSRSLHGVLVVPVSNTPTRSNQNTAVDTYVQHQIFTWSPVGTRIYVTP
jgi:hypothetical protein